MSKASSKAVLKDYQAKRDFSRTPEPSGGVSPKASGSGQGMFCVQKHLASHLHYDFRLEHHGVLLSWAVPKGPSLNPRDKRLAMRVEDHPLDYGDFEGVIPEGYGAGIVLLWDRGIWTHEGKDVDAALKEGELKFSLDGVKLKGSWVLVRTGGGRTDAGGDSRTWLLIKHRDRWAGEVDIIRDFPQSVKSFGDLPDILAADDPEVWNSHRPVKGGETGALLTKVIEEAAKLKAEKTIKKARSKRPPAKDKSPKSKSIKKTAKRRP